MTFFSIFLLTLPNATAQTIGFITFVGQFCGFLFEVPSGYLSDLLGHKKALVFGKLFIALSSLALLFADSVLHFIMASVLMAFGYALLSGTLSAFAKNTLDSLGRGEEFSSIMGKVRSLGYAIPIFLIIILPFVVDHYSYRGAFFVVFLIDVVGLLYTVLLKNVQQKKEVEEFSFSVKENVFKKYLKIGWFPYVIVSALIFSVLFSATAGFKNPFQEEIGFSISMLGILWAISRLGISGILLCSGWFKKHLNLKKVLMIQGFVFATVLVGVSLASNKWIVATLFIVGATFLWGFGSVQTHFYLDYIKDSSFKATFLSINNFIQKITTALLSLVMGYVALNFSYESGFLFFGILCFTIVLIGFLFLKNKKTA